MQRAGAQSIIASAKTVGLRLDRRLQARRDGGALSAGDNISPDVKQEDAAAIKYSDFFAGRCLPSATLARITRYRVHFRLLIWKKTFWTTKAVTDVLWKDGVPALSILVAGRAGPDAT